MSYREKVQQILTREPHMPNGVRESEIDGDEPSVHLSDEELAELREKRERRYIRNFPERVQEMFDDAAAFGWEKAAEEWRDRMRRTLGEL